MDAGFEPQRIEDAALPDAPPSGVRDVPSRPSRFTPERIIRWVIIAVTLAAAGWLLWYFSRLVTFLLIGAVLAYITRPLMDYFQSFALGRIPAILLTFVVFFGGISIVVTSLVPYVATQVTDLSNLITTDRITDIAATLEAQLGEAFVQEGALIDGLRNVFTTLFEEQRITTLVGSVVDLFTNLFYAIIVIPFIMFFFLKDGGRIRQSLLRMVPNRYFEVTLNIVEKVETNIGRYFQALVVQCLSVATVASLMLWMVGLKYALVVGVFTGLANTIPYFGPFMGLLAGALVSIAQTGDVSLVPGVLLAMLITQISDNVLFQPLIFSKAARAHPLVILFVVLMGAQLGGIVGMLVAIPLTTTFRVIVEQVVWSARNYRILRAAA